ncbi:MAG: dTDP-4-dehydrorhamnose reductase [uncultured Thermomicrobiales bacterium]|uniref:dTDP-4-dehydrorhamnose reductase n=1 Tax=uncultured Thermomicrobiales bacterium TaxID=1645740 RepID=A0A6J4VIV1_9BACT|nr:MAG: dTDP-4-dehydrorhamnose reductase [uncultured Thermomicrobiales bacterium]
MDHAAETILVTGSGGQLGRYLVAACRERGFRVIGLGANPGPGVDIQVDIGDAQAVTASIADVRPDVVIHGAAYTDVDGCERDPDKADRVNHLGAANVARAARSVGAHLIAVGTDFVFSGKRAEPYSERATPDPVSVYGSSKLAGERAVLDTDPSFAVARTAWVYGGAGKHFPRTVLTMIRDRGAMTVVDDEVSNPTFAGDLADSLVALVDKRPAGIFHLTNEGWVNRFGLARAVVEAAGGDPGVIQPTSTEAFLSRYPLPAKRPANSSLANNRARELGVTLPAWRDAVDRYVPTLARELNGQE